MYSKIPKRTSASGCLVLCLAAAAVGCAEKTPTIELTPVAGAVLLDGKPLAGAELTFYPNGMTAQGYSGSLGKTDAEGKYQLKAGARPGAAPGPFKVTIRRIVNASGTPVSAEGGMDMQQLAMQGLAKESLPEKYSSLEKTELTVTVEKDKAEGYDFHLKGS